MRPVRLELTAPRLKGGCSTTELRARKNDQRSFKGLFASGQTLNINIIQIFFRFEKFLFFLSEKQILSTHLL